MEEHRTAEARRAAVWLVAAFIVFMAASIGSCALQLRHPGLNDTDLVAINEFTAAMETAAEQRNSTEDRIAAVLEGFNLQFETNDCLACG